jgi:hypothetical protein
MAAKPSKKVGMDPRYTREKRMPQVNSIIREGLAQSFITIRARVKSHMEANRKTVGATAKFAGQVSSVRISHFQVPSIARMLFLPG